MTIELKAEFEGVGEVREYFFRQIRKSKKAFLYEVSNRESDSKHYEIFKRKTSNTYDFENRKKLIEKAVRYPKAKSFGVWAWTSTDYSRAVDIYEGLLK